jgi:glycosyltransferase involved in cell wall biosynthesis
VRTTFYSRLSKGQRWPALLKLWLERVPGGLRRVFSQLALPRAYYATAAHNLRAAERQICAAEYDVLLVHVDATPPGLCALAATLAAQQGRPLALVSMQGLAQELRAVNWGMARRLAHIYLGAACPPALFQPIRPAQAPQTIFASATWQAQAVCAGFPEERAHTIYFGVPLPPAKPRPAEPGQRILWVGRLSAEKGLHLLLHALPALRRRLPQVTVTAIAAQGSSAYRQLIADLIHRLELSDIVTVHPPVPRAALGEAYAAHDALFFHSIFDEPVALVLMEAFAAGLPVAASAAAGTQLVRANETCLTYDPLQPATVADALHALLTQASLRERLTANAQRLVRAEFSLEAMGQSYDALLRTCLMQSYP